MKMNKKIQYIVTIAFLLAMFAGGLNNDVVFGELSGNAVGGILHLNIDNKVGTVSGTVRDGDGNPIEGATVTATGQSATTGVDGTYSLDPVPTGDITVTVEAIGYESDFQIVNIPSGGNVDFVLAQGKLTVNEEVLDFGNQLYWIKSDPQQIVVTNGNQLAVKITRLARSRGDFLLAENNCLGVTLDTGESCTFNVLFRPREARFLTGKLTIYTDSVLPNEITLEGTGLSGTQLLKNKSFEQDANRDKIPDFWNASGLLSSDVRTNQIPAKSGAYSWMLVGSPGSSKNITQTIYKTGSAGDDYLFVLWSKASNVPSGYHYRTQISFYNGSSLTHRRIKDYAPGTHHWQYHWLPITVPGPYTQIVFEIIYTRPSGTVWFDSASLKWAP